MLILIIRTNGAKSIKQNEKSWFALNRDKKQSVEHVETNAAETERNREDMTRINKVEYEIIRLLLTALNYMRDYWTVNEAKCRNNTLFPQFWFNKTVPKMLKNYELWI